MHTSISRSTGINFDKTQHLKNSLNSMKEVKVGRDGQARTALTRWLVFISRRKSRRGSAKRFWS